MLSPFDETRDLDVEDNQSEGITDTLRQQIELLEKRVSDLEKQLDEASAHNLVQTQIIQNLQN